MSALRVNSGTARQKIAALVHARGVCELLSVWDSVRAQINQWSAMKRLGPATIGVSLMAAGALGAFIHARYFDSPKLCIEVMAQMMAKQKDVTPGMFMRETADLLDLRGVIDEKLNEAWQNWIIGVYAKNHSPAEAAQGMEDFRKRGNCI
jgi:hypothetical protein